MKHTSNWFGAAHAFLGIQIAEAIQAVWVVFSRGKALACQLSLASNASETLSVPGLILIRDTASCYGL